MEFKFGGERANDKKNVVVSLYHLHRAIQFSSKTIQYSEVKWLDKHSYKSSNGKWITIWFHFLFFFLVEIIFLTFKWFYKIACVSLLPSFLSPTLASSFILFLETHFPIGVIWHWFCVIIIVRCLNRNLWHPLASMVSLASCAHM